MGFFNARGGARFQGCLIGAHAVEVGNTPSRTRATRLRSVGKARRPLPTQVFFTLRTGRSCALSPVSEGRSGGCGHGILWFESPSGSYVRVWMLAGGKGKKARGASGPVEFYACSADGRGSGIRERQQSGTDCRANLDGETSVTVQTATAVVMHQIEAAARASAPYAYRGDLLHSPRLERIHSAQESRFQRASLFRHYLLHPGTKRRPARVRRGPRLIRDQRHEQLWGGERQQSGSDGQFCKNGAVHLRWVRITLE